VRFIAIGRFLNYEVYCDFQRREKRRYSLDFTAFQVVFQRKRAGKGEAALSLLSDNHKIFCGKVDFIATVGVDNFF
jgi:hypothetical protein